MEWFPKCCFLSLKRQTVIGILKSLVLSTRLDVYTKPRASIIALGLGEGNFVRGGTCTAPEQPILLIALYV